MPMALAAVLGAGLATAGGEVMRRLSPAPQSPEITALKAQIAELQQRPVPQAPNLAPLTSKLAEVEQAVGRIARAPAPGTATPDPAVVSRLAQIEAGLTEVRDRKPADMPSLEPVTSRMAALEQRLQQRGTEVDPRLKTLTDDLAAVRKNVGMAAVAPAFGAVQAVASAFNQGQPYQLELEGAEALALQGMDLSALRPLAARGAPTLQRLATEFRVLSEQVARETDRGPQNAVMGFLDRFIKVRPVGTPGGSSVFDLLATMDGHVQRGTLAEAVAVAARLPEPARQKLAPWLQTAEQRHKAASALTAAQQMVLSALKAQRP